MKAIEVQKIFLSYNQSISLRSAYRYISFIKKEGLTVDYALVSDIARMRLTCKFLVNNVKAIEFYLYIRKKLAKGGNKITGCEFVILLENQIGLQIPKSTLSGWFKPLGGFKKDKEYLTDLISGLIVKAYILYQKLEDGNL